MVNIRCKVNIRRHNSEIFRALSVFHSMIKCKHGRTYMSTCIHMIGVLGLNYPQFTVGLDSIQLTRGQVLCPSFPSPFGICPTSLCVVYRGLLLYVFSGICGRLWNGSPADTDVLVYSFEGGFLCFSNLPLWQERDISNSLLMVQHSGISF